MRKYRRYKTEARFNSGDISMDRIRDREWDDEMSLQDLEMNLHLIEIPQGNRPGQRDWQEYDDWDDERYDLRMAAKKSKLNSQIPLTDDEFYDFAVSYLGGKGYANIWMGYWREIKKKIM